MKPSSPISAAACNSLFPRDVAELIALKLKVEGQHVSPTALNRWARHWRQWRAFAESETRPSMPMTHDLVARFLAAGFTRGLQHSSLKGMLATLVLVNRAAGLDPPWDDEVTDPSSLVHDHLRKVRSTHLVVAAPVVEARSEAAEAPLSWDQSNEASPQVFENDQPKICPAPVQSLAVAPVECPSEAGAISVPNIVQVEEPMTWAEINEPSWQVPQIDQQLPIPAVEKLPGVLDTWPDEPDVVMVPNIGPKSPFSDEFYVQGRRTPIEYSDAENLFVEAKHQYMLGGANRQSLLPYIRREMSERRYENASCILQGVILASGGYRRWAEKASVSDALLESHIKDAQSLNDSPVVVRLLRAIWPAGQVD